MTTDHVVVRPYFQDDAVTIIHGDSREVLPTLDRAAWCGISTLNPRVDGAADEQTKKEQGT